MVLKFFNLTLCIIFIPLVLLACAAWVVFWGILALLWFLLGIGFLCAGIASIVGFLVFMPIAQMILESLNDSGIFQIIESGPAAFWEIWQNKFNENLYYNPQNLLY